MGARKRNDSAGLAVLVLFAVGSIYSLSQQSIDSENAATINSEKLNSAVNSAVLDSPSVAARSSELTSTTAGREGLIKIGAKHQPLMCNRMEVDMVFDNARGGLVPVAASLLRQNMTVAGIVNKGQ